MEFEKLKASGAVKSMLAYAGCFDYLMAQRVLAIFDDVDLTSDYDWLLAYKDLLKGVIGIENP